jgi:hypothetical protein
MNSFLVRKSAGSTSRIESDSELVVFLNSIDRYYTIKELRKQLVEKFGEDRTPSMSAIHRYLTKITKAAGQDKGGI